MLPILTELVYQWLDSTSKVSTIFFSTNYNAEIISGLLGSGLISKKRKELHSITFALGRLVPKWKLTVLLGTMK
jgi:hypothetical protein